MALKGTELLEAPLVSMCLGSVHVNTLMSKATVIALYK